MLPRHHLFPNVKHRGRGEAKMPRATHKEKAMIFIDRRLLKKK
jgi:hypothetical protein